MKKIRESAGCVLKKWLPGIVLLIFSGYLLSSCAGRVPPITDSPTDRYQYGKFVWADLVTNDLPAVKRFYGELFAWEFEGGDKARFNLITHMGKRIGGLVYSERLDEKVSESRWLSYLSVPDVDRATDYILQNGGIIHRTPWDLKNRGRISVIADPQGAIFALLKASEGDPVDERPRFGEFLWTELLTTDDDAAVLFYKKLVGYDLEVRNPREDVNYHILKKDELPRAGIIKSPWPEVKPNWLPYIRVEDPRAVVEQVEKYGGRVLLEPHPDIRKGSVAVIADPTGAPVAVQKWPIE